MTSSCWAHQAGNSTLLANCSSYPFGFLRVDLESTYTLLKALLGDVSKAFPDAVYNIGGDEMNNACWNQSAEVAGQFSCLPLCLLLHHSVWTW
jgi:N-acetyl-beta-hexosaminidase